MSRQRWTPDELALLDGPASDVEVAELVGRSVHAVVMKRWRRRNPAAVARDRVYAEENRDRNKRRAVIYSQKQRDKINAAARAAAAADRVAATRSGPFTPERRCAGVASRPDSSTGGRAVGSNSCFGGPETQTATRMRGAGGPLSARLA